MAKPDTLITRIPASEVISDERVAALRGKTGAERLQVVSDLNRSARGMLINNSWREHRSG